MRKSLSLLVAMIFVLAAVNAAAAIDPRDDMAACGYTSVDETWEPDMATGIMTKRVTYTTVCDTPTAGDIGITITTEEWNGMSLEVTEVRQGTRTESGGIYTTELEIYDGSMALLGKEVHTYDNGVTDPTVEWQDWTNYVWTGSAFEVERYTSREMGPLDAQDRLVTWIFYDTTFRADPEIPTEVPVLGGTTASMSGLPPFMSKVDPETWNQEGMRELGKRVLDMHRVSINTPYEANLFLNHYSPNLTASGLYANPPGTYVASVLIADQFLNEDPITGLAFTGLFNRWVKMSNDVAGDLTILYGWTSDRQLNQPSNDWWQSRVAQWADGSLEWIENAHRVGETEADHQDLYTVMNDMFQITEQTYKVFTWTGDDFSELSTTVDRFQNPLYEQLWVVTW